MQRIRTVTPPTFYARLKILVGKSCPLNNSETLLDISRNLVQILSTIGQELFSSNILMELYPFEYSVGNSRLLNNFETNSGIFARLCTYIKHHQAMCR